MDHLWTVKRFCRWKYGLEVGQEPTLSQVHIVERMCKKKLLPATKVGKEWRIDTSEILKELEHAKR